MKAIIFGTTNPSKLIHARATLEPLGIKVRGLGDFKNLPEIEEDGKTPQENARKKALFYHKRIDQPVLSMDNALYIDGLKKSEQPGIHTRRVPGIISKPSDEDLIKYYSLLFAKHGGEMTGHWEFAMCLVTPGGQLKEATAISDTRKFTSKVCSKRLPGYPLESMQFDLKTNKYVVEMTKAEQDKFWQNSIGKELKKLFDNF